MGYGLVYFGDDASMGDGPRIGRQHFNPRSIMPSLINQMKKDAEGSGLGNKVPEFAVRLGVRKNYIASGLVKTAPQGTPITNFIKWSTAAKHSDAQVELIDGNHRITVLQQLYRKQVEVYYGIESELKMPGVLNPGELKDRQAKAFDELVTNAVWAAEIFDLGKTNAQLSV